MEYEPNIQRLKIGIVLNFNPVWMGGIVYIINIIKTLGFLEDTDKPEIFLFYRSDQKKVVSQIEYPYLHPIEWKFPNVYAGYIKSILTIKNVFINDIISQYNLDGLYPVSDYPVKIRTSTRVVSWLADLQHKYYPGFFSKRKILERNARIKLILLNSNDLVVSSKTVADDLRRFYRVPNRISISIFHFVSVIDNIEDLDINWVREKYQIPEKYFIVSNQFHKHKNHIVLFKALARLRKENINIHLAITGRFPEASHSSYMKELHEIIDRNQLESQVRFLGVIPRNEQLLLMQNSQAVLQPSLFEGWSTVIEDAISLQAPVIASSIPVNLEQLGPTGHYFDPHDDAKLAEILCHFPSRNLDDRFYDGYRERVINAAHMFKSIFIH